MALPQRRIGLAGFNEGAADELEPSLLACCRSRAWAAEVLAGRPYATAGDAAQAGEQALSRLTEHDIDEVLAAHPRIGEATQDEQSRREQAGTAGADQGVRTALEDGNRAYERRFGHVYLVCATGRTADELLDQLRDRLGNDPATERAVLRQELAKINRLRLERLLGP